MNYLNRTIRLGLVTAFVGAGAACSQATSIGEVLGSVLGGGAGGGSGASQVSGSIQQVDTRNQQIALRQSNGQTVGLAYDGQTKVVYQNQNYPVTNLEYGDQVTARIKQMQNGGYYTDLVQVDQSAQTSTGSGSTNQTLQQFQGQVRRVDVANGWFTIDGSNGATLTVSMPYNPARGDLQRFQGLRAGDTVRFGGVYLNNTRVELRQFY